MTDSIEKDVNFLNTKIERVVLSLKERIESEVLRLNTSLESEMVRLTARMDRQVFCLNQRLDKQVAKILQTPVIRLSRKISNPLPAEHNLISKGIRKKLLKTFPRKILKVDKKFEQVTSLQQDVTALQRRADYLLNVITRISRINNQSWTMAIGLFDDVEERLSPQCEQQEEEPLLDNCHPAPL